jgi:hypothetical protein
VSEKRSSVKTSLFFARVARKRSLLQNQRSFSAWVSWNTTYRLFSARDVRKSDLSFESSSECSNQRFFKNELSLFLRLSARNQQFSFVKSRLLENQRLSLAFAQSHSSSLVLARESKVISRSRSSLFPSRSRIRVFFQESCFRMTITYYCSWTLWTRTTSICLLCDCRNQRA